MRVARIAATSTAITTILSAPESVRDAAGALSKRAERAGTAGETGVRSQVMARIFLARWVFNVIALFVAAWILSGVSYGDEWWSLLIAGLVFTVVNAFVKPILTVLSIPFIVVTLGLFYFLINILMLYITDWIVSDFELDNFWWAALAAIIVSIVNWILHVAFGEPASRREAPAY
jgi:putative membrane protein